MNEYRYDLFGSVASVEAFSFNSFVLKAAVTDTYHSRPALLTASLYFVLHFVLLFLSAKYCGLKVKELINSTGNQVTVQFMSGTHNSGRGFYLSYSTTEHTGNLSQSWGDNEIRGG